MQAIQKAKNNFHQKWFRHALFRRQQEDNKIATTSRFLTKINADYKTKTPSKRGLSNLTINFDTGDRGHHCYNTAVLDDRLQHHCNNRFNCNNSAFDRFSKRIFMQRFEYKALSKCRAFIFLHKKIPPKNGGCSGACRSCKISQLRSRPT